MPDVIEQHHTSVMGGHFAANMTENRIGQFFWWPTMRKDIAEYVKHCEICQRTGPKKPPVQKCPLICRQPWDIIQLDWVLGLPVTQRGCKCIVVAIDICTGFVAARAFTTCTAADTTAFFLEAIALRYGLPRIVHTDNGSHFLGTFRELCIKWGIKQSFSSPYYPQSHGKVERANKMILGCLRKQCTQNWDQSLAATVFAVNSRSSNRQPHSSLELLCGVRPRGPTEVTLVKELVEGLNIQEEEEPQQRLEKLDIMRQEQADLREKQTRKWAVRRSPDLQVGDLVLVWNETRNHKLEEQWKGPAAIVWVGKHGAVGVKFPREDRVKQLATHKVKRFWPASTALETNPHKRREDDEGPSEMQPNTKRHRE